MPRGTNIAMMVGGGLGTIVPLSILLDHGLPLIWSAGKALNRDFLLTW
jgi:hypothetical protein